MEKIKKRLWASLLIALCFAAALIEFFSIHNPYASAVATLITCVLLVGYYFLLNFASGIEANEHGEISIMKRFLGATSIHGLVMVIVIILVALLTSAWPNTTINWSGIFLTAVVLFIAILFSSAIGIHQGVQDPS